MIATVDALLNQAMVLPDDSRLELAERLLFSVPEEDDVALDTLLRSRIDDIESGRVQAVDADEVFQRIETMLASRA